MGEYAEIELGRAMRHGSTVSNKPKRRKLVMCYICNKEYRGESGLMQHQNAKHDTSFTWGEICWTTNEYEN